MNPTISILIPVKNAAGNLQTLTENLAALDYDHRRLSVTFLEGDSDDGSHDLLQRFSEPLRSLFGRVGVHKHDLGNAAYSQDGRREISHQRERRARIAKARNRLLHLGLKNEDFALWTDFDDSVAPALNQDRIFNAGNEITGITNPSGAVTPVFDAVGRMKAGA